MGHLVPASGAHAWIFSWKHNKVPLLPKCTAEKVEQTGLHTGQMFTFYAPRALVLAEIIATPQENIFKFHFRLLGTHIRGPGAVCVHLGSHDRLLCKAA